MKATRTALCLLSATIAFAAVPPLAAAEAYVPPSNSAATQYTEAVPTAGGPKATGKSKHPQSKAPAKVLGSHNAGKLNAQGREGREAAEVAAATAPPSISASASAPETGEAAGNAAGRGHDGTGGLEPSGQTPTNRRNQSDGAAPAHARAAQADSSSGFGEVIGQATGSSSSGQLGLLLPLLIVGAVALSIVYVLRQRKRPTG